MAVVWIPALPRPLAGGQDQVRAAGITLREVIDDLDRQFAGFRDRLLEDGVIRPEVALSIGGAQAADLCAAVGADDEVHILPAIAGGN